MVSLQGLNGDHGHGSVAFGEVGDEGSARGREDERELGRERGKRGLLR